MAYETLFETEFRLDSSLVFKPNVFVDITTYFEQDIELLKIYSTELGEFPFSINETAIKPLAQFRGSSSRFKNAVGFELLLERNG